MRILEPVETCGAVITFELKRENEDEMSSLQYLLIAMECALSHSLVCSLSLAPTDRAARLCRSHRRMHIRRFDLSRWIRSHSHLYLVFFHNDTLLRLILPPFPLNTFTPAFFIVSLIKKDIK